jgi:hypothetical protein
MMPAAGDAGDGDNMLQLPRGGKRRPSSFFAHDFAAPDELNYTIE